MGSRVVYLDYFIIGNDRHDETLLFSLNSWLCIERSHSRDKQLCKFIGTKENACMRKEFNSHGIRLVQQHVHRFTVFEHQYGCRDVM